MSFLLLFHIFEFFLVHFAMRALGQLIHDFHILGDHKALHSWRTQLDDALFSQFGYYKMFTEGCERPEALTKNLGKNYYYDSTIKPYCCCRIPHAAIDGALTLAKKYSLKADDIASVNLYLAQGGIDHKCGHPFKIGPFPHGDAAFSYEYVVATAFLFGGVRPENFTEEAIHSPQVAEFMKKIKLTAAADVAFEKARVTVTLKDGRELTENIVSVKGDPLSNPMTHDDIIAKFWTNLEFSEKISRPKAEKLLESIEKIEKLDSVKEIIPLLTA